MWYLTVHKAMKYQNIDQIDLISFLKLFDLFRETFRNHLFQLNRNLNNYRKINWKKRMCLQCKLAIDLPFISMIIINCIIRLLNRVI